MEAKFISPIKLVKERSCHMSAYSQKQNRLYVMGGFDGYESLNEMEFVDLNEPEPKFEALPDMPSRIKNGFAVFNEQDQCIYMLGGWDEKNTTTSVFKFNTLTNKTSFDGTLPKQFEGHACVYVPETQTVFIFGGFDDFGVTDRIMRYDLNAHSGDVIYG